MALVLSTRPTFKYKVKVKQPNDKGDLVAIEFLGEFTRLQQPEVDELLKSPPGDQGIIDRVFVAWSGVKTIVKVEDKDVEQDLIVTDDNRAALLAEPGVRAAIVRAYLDAVLFGPAKN
jgi:hypothetical protein